MSSSDRLYEVLHKYWWSSQYPDIQELAQLLKDVTHEEKVSILKSLTTLSTAAMCGHTKIVTTIVSSVPRHRRLDVLLQKEYTPLHTAAWFGRSDCVETILSHLTPEQHMEVLTLRDEDGGKPADWASHNGHNNTERLLGRYQQRAEKQINTVRKTVSDNNNEISSLTRKLQQTKLQLDNQAKDIQTLVSAVADLDTSNKNKDEILQKITEESRELKSTVQDMKEEIDKQTTKADKRQKENEQHREQVLQKQTEINKLQEKTTNLCNTVDELRAFGDARDKQHQDDITNLKLHYDTKLAEQHEQITRQHDQIVTEQRQQTTQQQEQIAQLRDEMRATVAVRNMAMSNLNDRVEVLGPTCTNLREDVDRIDETVERIDEHFYPESNAVGRGAPHDGGDEIVEEQLTVPQLATNA